MFGYEERPARQIEPSLYFVFHLCEGCGLAVPRFMLEGVVDVIECPRCGARRRFAALCGHVGFVEVHGPTKAWKKDA